MDAASGPWQWLRRALPWVGCATALLFIYDGTMFYSRWSQAKEGAQAEANAQAERARRDLALQGGDGLRITSFYASPGVIRRGEPANLCYGVNGAKKVELHPPAADVWPSLSRCLQVSPREDTTYELVAQDAAGHSVSQTFALKVAR